MSTFPNSPRTLRGGLVLIDPESAVVRRVIVLQYNPDSLTRTLQVRGVAAEAGDRLESLRLTGPPAETIKLEAEIDATDQLEFPDRNRAAVEVGIHPQLAALETIVYPSSAQIQLNHNLALSGSIEIVPVEAPLTLFVWSKERVMPVNITEFTVTEESFDPNLNPVRAKISLGLRVLSTNDLSFSTRGASIFMSYLQQKERLAKRNPEGTLGALGITRIP